MRTPSHNDMPHRDMPHSDMATHSDFSASWLALREAADHRARDDQQLLINTCRDWLASRPHQSDLQLLDLGCGSGSNLRYLASRLPPRQHWILIDQDPDLLAHARDDGRPPHGNIIDIDCRTRNLFDLDQALPHHVLADTDIVTASALLDLVSKPWLETLIKRCASHQCVLWLAMSIDGDNVLIDRKDRSVDADLLAMDQRVQQLIRAHQQRDKGFNGALGTQAPTVAADLLTQAGYRVIKTRSLWRLDGSDPDQALLARALVQGWLEAALEQSPEEREALMTWHENRQRDIADGRLTITVGHTDLFAVPGVS
ncbi:Methyltransferase domain-containing protein [Kushneria avicenniae]|uniref:Methyltransferase domain-containing protein n=1 Tax=Kushneria avicenniae TaxID=402385 RepID=A0A1I1GIB8_9GAMM|nr:class I SAM-dependent methyltransferase [Kushneria avicenniae]SFC11251.1 Methyltransferase domain-containing protein [Kushneria avicenniae]